MPSTATNAIQDARFFEATVALESCRRHPQAAVRRARKNDPRVPLSESVQIVETMRTNKTPIWYPMADDEGHGFAKKKNADFQFYATVMFIQGHLLVP